MASVYGAWKRSHPGAASEPSTGSGGRRARRASVRRRYDKPDVLLRRECIVMNRKLRCYIARNGVRCIVAAQASARDKSADRCHKVPKRWSIDFLSDVITDGRRIRIRRRFHARMTGSGRQYGLPRLWVGTRARRRNWIRGRPAMIAPAWRCYDVRGKAGRVALH